MITVVVIYVDMMGGPGIEEAARSGQRSSLSVDGSRVSHALSSQYSQDSTKRMLRDGARYGQADLLAVCVE